MRKKETILGLPKAIANSDDEPMGITISYEEDEKEWSISYTDEGSAIAVYGKTLDEAIENIRKECRKVYRCELEARAV
jgi:hypothetical protein